MSPDDAVRSAAQLAQAGRINEAVAALQSVLRQDPRHVEANRMMALALLSSGQFPQGLAHIERAIAGAPQRADLHHFHAEALAMSGQLDRAIESLDRSIELKPDNAQAHALLATCLLQQRDLDGAEDEYAEALRLNPGYPEAATNYGNALTMTGRPQEGAQVLRDAAAKFPTHLGVLTNAAVALNYADGVSREELFEAHARYGRALANLPVPPLPPLSNSRDPERRLRIGLLSPDLQDHSVAYFVQPMLAGRDRAAFEYYVYSTAPRADTMTGSIRALTDAWRDVPRASDQQLVQQIRSDGVDILIELSGQTQGNKLSALRMRAAPVQVSYIGYPNTTGVPNIDDRVVDSLTDPGAADAFATETLLRLDPCFLCYTPSPAAPSPSPPPFVSAGHVTFGSFNSIKKLTPSTIELWCRLLREVEHSRLIIKSGGLSSQHAQDHLRGLIRSHDIDDGRFELHDRIDSKAEHLAAYSQLDLALDTFPYHGTTTTCEALWQGVPVVSLVGDRHASRVGLSLLSAVGLADLATSTPDDFVRVAAALARDPSRLAELRRTLRPNMQRSPLCDAAAFVTRFEALLRRMWRDHCAT
jgi:predicted O-linked N-acetylglucosamine transferase (SPINDLY family)